MRNWDDREKNNNYSMPTEKTRRSLGFILWGFVAIGIIYAGTFALDWFLAAPKVAP